MKFEKGKSGNPAGKPKGAVNKATLKAREAIASLVDGNIERVQGWLDEIYEEKGAQAALDSFTGLIEYHVPKLARAEMTGKDGKDLIPENINITLRKPDGH